MFDISLRNRNLMKGCFRICILSVNQFHVERQFSRKRIYEGRIRKTGDAFNFSLKFKQNPGVNPRAYRRAGS